MKLLILAARNLFRNGRRTVITLLAIAFGLSMMVIMVNLQRGQYDEMIDKGVSQLSGHVVVQAEGYQADPEPELVVTEASAVADTLAETFPEATIAPRIVLGGLLQSPTSSVGGGLSGVDPAAEASIGELDDRLVAGEWLAPDDDRGIVIGQAMAERLKVEVGDKVVWMGQYGSNEVTSRLFRVRGVFRMGSAEMDGFLAVAPIAAAQELLAMDDVANQVTVHLTDGNLAEAATAEAAQRLADRMDLEVLSWKGAMPELYELIRLDRNSGDVMMAILGLIVAMGVLNTVLMSALERTREFGVLLAIGMKPRQLASLVLAEGAVLGLLGGLLGLALGAALTWPMAEYGLDYSAYMGGETMESNGIAVSTLVKSKYDPVRMSLYAGLTVLFTLLSALYPAIHVARLRPVAAMRAT